MLKINVKNQISQSRFISEHLKNFWNGGLEKRKSGQKRLFWTLRKLMTKGRESYNRLS